MRTVKFRNRLTAEVDFQVLELTLDLESWYKLDDFTVGEALRGRRGQC